MLLRMTSSAIALMVLTAPAMADVTPEQVWQDWLDYFETTGYDVTEGSRELAGSTLTVKDVAFSFEADETQVSFTVPEVKMQETGDGGVRTTYTDQQDVLVAGTDPDGENFSLTLHMAYPGNEMVSSGDKGNMTHAYSYPELSIQIKELKTDGKTLDLPITVDLKGSTGTFQNVQGDKPAWTMQHKSESLTASANIDQPEGKFNLTASMDGLEAAGKIITPGPDMNIAEDMPAALKAGFASDGTIKMGAMTANFDFLDPADDTGGKGTMSSGPSDVAYQISLDGLGYQVSSSDLNVEVTSSQMPFPIRYSLESSAVEMMLPIMKSDDAQPFKVAYSLAGLKLGDQIWDMFDPTRTLNRDPANIDLDVSGLLRVVKDVMDTSPSEDPVTDSPFEPVEITLNQFGLNALGAKVHATGEVRPSAEGGMEQPVGKALVKFSGVAELIQTLAQMGLVPSEQVMTANMMIGMFSVEDPDNAGGRKTELEMKEDGSVFANGTQLQ